MNAAALKPRHLALGAALVGAALLVAFGDRTPADGVIGAVERPATGTPAATAAKLLAQPAAVLLPRVARDDAAPRPAAADAPVQQILALTPRTVLIGDGDDGFQQSGAGPFAHQDWTPPPPPPPSSAALAPPPPSAPPLPFTFIGKSVGGGAWEIYLSRGERTYVVRDKGAVLDGTYRVESIAPPVLTLTYLPLNQQQQLNIGVFD